MSCICEHLYWGVGEAHFNHLFRGEDMRKFPFLTRGRSRMFSDTINWALYGGINDIGFATSSGFNAYYGDLYGSGEETFPRHMAHRSIDFQRQNLGVNRAHIDAIHAAGMAYIYYSSSCTFDQSYFDNQTVESFAGKYEMHADAFGTPGRRYACFNSPAWLKFQIDKTVMLVKEFGFEGVFFDNLFYMLPCLCERCVDKFRSLTGMNLLEVSREISMLDTDEVVHNKGFNGRQTNISDLGKYKKYLRYAEFRRKSIEDFIRAYRKGVEAQIGHPFAITANTHLITSEAVEICKTGIFDAYLTENGYSFPPETNEFSYKLGAAIQPDKRRAVIVFTRTLEGMPTSGMFKSAMGESMAGGGFLTPWGFVLHESSDHKREVARYTRFYEANEEIFARQDNIADVAVVTPSLASLVKKLAGDEEQYTNNGAMVACRMLADINIVHDVLLDSDIFDEATLSKYSLIVLPEVDIISDSNFAILKELAAKGTKILITCDSLRYDTELNERMEKLEGNGVLHIPEIFPREYTHERLKEKYEIINAFDHVKALQELYTDGILKTTAAPLTHITVTASECEILVHFVNYNTNRGPYSTRVIPDYNIKTTVCPGRIVTEAYVFTPDNCGEPQRLPFEMENGHITFTLPQLEYYSFVRLR